MSLETFYGFSFNYIYVAPILVYGFGLFRLFGIFRYFFRVYDRYGLNALVYALTLVSFAAFLVFASALNILERVFS